MDPDPADSPNPPPCKIVQVKFVPETVLVNGILVVVPLQIVSINRFVTDGMGCTVTRVETSAVTLQSPSNRT